MSRAALWFSYGKNSHIALGSGSRSPPAAAQGRAFTGAAGRTGGLSEDYISGMERGIQCGSLTAIVHIASALRMEAAELVRLIEAEMGAGPHPPGRGAGKPPKREKK